MEAISIIQILIVMQKMAHGIVLTRAAVPKSRSKKIVMEVAQAGKVK